MRLLINFATLKKGGGQNVGLNFINGLKKESFPEIDFYFAVAKDTQIEKRLKENGFTNILSLSQNAGKRILQEITKVNLYIANNKIDAIYTCFGYALIKKSVCQICGVADSNLLYPEVDFWEGYTGLSKLKKRIIDGYRLWGYKRARGLIFENKAMETRAKLIFGPACKSIYIKPSFSIKNEKEEAVPLSNSDQTKLGLFFCGWQRNKGIMKIPEMLNEARKIGFPLIVCISASLDYSDQVCLDFLSEVNKYQVGDLIIYLGTIKKNQIKDLYEKVNYVFLLSKLESFSNNIIEAWYYKKPLIIADEEWSRGICNEAALYVNRNEPKEIIDSILLASSDKTINRIVKEGTKEFLTYPSIEQKVTEELAYVKEIYGMDKI